MQRNRWRVNTWLLLTLPALAAAQAPELLGYQGRLIRNNGSPETGATQMRFTFYGSASGGAARWEEEQSLNLVDGYYATQLGKVVPFTAGLFDDGALYLEVAVKATGDTGFKAMVPRQRVASVAWALSAKNLKGGTVDATSVTINGKAAVAANVSGCTSGQFLSWDGAAWVCATANGSGGTTYAAGTGISIDANNTISVTSGGCSAGNVLQWTGSAWTCAQVSGGGGGVTSVNTGTGLTGGPITSTGTIAISNGGIASVHLAAGAVTAAKLSSNGCSVNDVMRWNGTAWVCVSLDYGRTPQNPGTSCRDIKSKASWATDGMYLIDLDGPSTGTPAFQVYCDMTRDGGGWTLILRTWYQSGMAGKADGFGSPYEANMPRYEPYKLPDATIQAIIGSDNHFDLLADQVFHNTQQSLGNHEFIVLRNYTGLFTYAAPVAESTTETVMESFRAHDNALLWRGRLGCGPLAGGAPGAGFGINCDTVLTTPEPVGMANPQGGAGCVTPFPGSSGSMGDHQLYMGGTNTDTYQKICNGAQYTSSYSNVHRWWVR